MSAGLLRPPLYTCGNYEMLEAGARSKWSIQCGDQYDGMLLNFPVTANLHVQIFFSRRDLCPRCERLFGVISLQGICPSIRGFELTTQIQPSCSHLKPVLSCSLLGHSVHVRKLFFYVCEADQCLRSSITFAYSMGRLIIRL